MYRSANFTIGGGREPVLDKYISTCEKTKRRASGKSYSGFSSQRYSLIQKIRYLPKDTWAME
jgi:hypothetical protein